MNLNQCLGFYIIRYIFVYKLRSFSCNSQQEEYYNQLEHSQVCYRNEFMIMEWDFYNILKLKWVTQNNPILSSIKSFIQNFHHINKYFLLYLSYFKSC